ncbi:MAG: hypothetical protein QXL17_02930 [Candidatus Thermoplasmatota archaeon]
MKDVLVIHPTKNDVDDAELNKVVDSLDEKSWYDYESEFNFDGPYVMAGEYKYFPEAKRISMPAQEYVDLVNAASRSKI